MPNSIIKKFSKETGKSVEEIETLWDEIKNSLDKTDKFLYPKVVSILKKKIGLNESLSYREFNEIKEITNEFNRS